MYLYTRLLCTLYLYLYLIILSDNAPHVWQQLAAAGHASASSPVQAHIGHRVRHLRPRREHNKLNNNVDKAVEQQT